TVKPGLETAAYRVEPLLEVRSEENGEIWAEKNLSVLSNPEVVLVDMIRSGKVHEIASPKPLPIAAGVLDRDNKPRMVVIGDARFANNAYIVPGLPYYDFLTSSIEWLAERPDNIGIAPQQTGSFSLRETDINPNRLLFLPLGLAVLGLIAL